MIQILECKKFLVLLRFLLKFNVLYLIATMDFIYSL